MIVARFVSFLVPYMFAELVHMFEEGAYSRKVWAYLFAYVGLRFLQASGGLPALREALWAPVMQYSDRGAWLSVLRVRGGGGTDGVWGA